MVCYIQDEMIQELISECPDLMPTDDSGNITLSFNSSEKFSDAYDLSQISFKRIFDEEEHYCGICMRDLLGDKFTFLSSCEHYF